MDNNNSTVKEKIEYTWAVRFDTLSSPFPDIKKVTQWIMELVPTIDSSYNLRIYCVDRDGVYKGNVTVNVTLIDTRNSIPIILDPEYNTFPEPFNFRKHLFSINIDQSAFIDIFYKYSLTIKVIIETDIERVCPQLKQKFEDLNPLVALTKDFQSLLTSHKFTDFVIKVDSTEIGVHKAILASRSAVFSAMLESNLAEINSGYVEIKDCDKDTMQLFLQFIYFGKMDITCEEEAKKLFIIADKYEVLDLKKISENYLRSKIDVSTVDEILILADRYSAYELKNEAIIYIIENLSKFSNKVLYEKLSENSPHLLIELLGKISEYFSVITKTHLEKAHPQLKQNFENPNPLVALINNLQSLLTSHKFTDFVIKVDSTEIAVHKAVLASRSPVFFSMLENNLSENNSGYMEIKDCDKNTMSLFLQFIYFGKLDITCEDEAKKLFIIADKYEVLDLKKNSENYLRSKINVSTVGEILILADRYSAKELKKEAITYIIENMGELSNKDVYEKIGENSAHLLIELLKTISASKSS